jgi:membrane protease YdiL (CAAX protease family)
VSLSLPSHDGFATDWPPRFHRSGLPVLGFVLFFAAWVVFTNAVRAELLGPDSGVIAERLLGVASSSVQFGVVLLLLRYEGVRLRDLGLDRRLLVPALIAVGGVVVAFNAAVAGLAALGGTAPSVGFPTVPPEYSPLDAAVTGVYFYLFVGPAEELAFRGYLQNKLAALVGTGRERIRRAIGVASAAVLFSLLHVPALVFVGDVRLQGAVGVLIVLALSGLTFGVVYELTRNLYLVALLHAIGDFWPLFVDPGPVGWPNWGVVSVCYALLVLAYRTWAPQTPSSTASTP